MKKSLILFSVAALALVSCAKVSDKYVSAPESNEIAFSPLAQPQTKAISNTNHGYINGTTFDTAWGMTVSAVDVANNSQSFFDETNFVYNATPLLWNGETHRYWPLSPVQVNFLAIAHANADNTTDVTWTNSNSDHKVVVVMSDNYAYNTAQRDFLYAIGNGQVTQNGNNLSFPAKVDMAFKHTQAYLVFNLLAADAASENIIITNVELKGVYTSGTATIARHAPGAYADSDVDLKWETRGGTPSAAYASVTASQAAISSALSTSGAELGHLMVVPNMSTINTPADNGTTLLKISYTLNGNAYTYEYEIANDTFAPGKKYIYNITFKLHEIFIAPTVVDWEAETTDIMVPSVPYAATANVSIGATPGTYTFTISGVPANGGETYSIVEGSAGTDFVTTVTKTADTTTSSDPGYITIDVVSAGGVADATRDLKLKLGATEKMTITLVLKSSI